MTIKNNYLQFVDIKILNWFYILLLLEQVKTLSPLGLTDSHKIIFLCAARHVGLALAKSAISMGKKIAFAFGCNDVSDIRLHYFAAKDYVKHNKTGRDIKYKDGSQESR